MEPQTRSPVVVLDPRTDDPPLAESDEHRDCVARIIELLAHFFRARQVYVSGRLLVQGREDDPEDAVCPDVFAVKDRDRHGRRVYQVWAEGKAPDFVLEVTSNASQYDDLVTKMRWYALLGVPEYFLYDPLGEYLKPRLLAYRLTGGGYLPVAPDADAGITSEQLGLVFRLEQGRLVLVDRETQERVLTGAERAEVAERRILDTEAEVWAAKIQVGEVEARVRELEEQLARLQSGRGT
jgi:Uma2 family endonuclease